MPRPKATPTTPAASCLSDQDLIQAFVDGFVQGRPVLLSNQNLRTEPLFESLQLMAKDEGLVSTANLIKPPITALVRSSSNYWQPLHAALSAQGFFPTNKTGKGDNYTYCYCEAPEGYEVNCTTAREFWRACWSRGFSARAGIPLDVLIWYQKSTTPRQGWQAIRGIDCDAGQLVIKLLGGAMEVSSSDLVVWAKQLSKHSPVSRTNHRQRTSVRGYLRLNS